MSKKEVKFMATDKSAGKVKEKMDEIHENAAPNQNIVAGREKPAEKPREPGTMDTQFPTDDLTEEDPRDKIMAAKIALANQQGVTPFGQLIASDSDFDWLDKKRAKQDEADLQAWFAQNYDHMAPEQKAVARKLWPDFYAQRQKMLDRNVALQHRIANLKLHGPQNKDDLMLLYAIESGYIPADPLENILHPEKVEEAKQLEARQKTYVRGLLNPKARVSRGGGTKDRKHNAKTLTEFNPDLIPGRPAVSGTNDNGSQFGFSGSGWPVFQSEEAKLFGPGMMKNFNPSAAGVQ